MIDKSLYACPFFFVTCYVFLYNWWHCMVCIETYEDKGIGCMPHVSCVDNNSPSVFFFHMKGNMIYKFMEN